MSYKIMVDDRCVNNRIETLAQAQKIATNYACEGDVDLVHIKNESTGKTVAIGHSFSAMKWTHTP